MAMESDKDGWSDVSGGSLAEVGMEDSREGGGGWSDESSDKDMAADGAERSDSASWGRQSDCEDSGAPEVAALAAPEAVPVLRPKGRGRGRGRPRRNPVVPAGRTEAATGIPAPPEAVLERGLLALSGPLTQVTPDCTITEGTLLRMRKVDSIGKAPALAVPMLHGFYCGTAATEHDPAMMAVAAVELTDAPVPMMSQRVRAGWMPGGFSPEVINNRTDLLAATCLQFQKSLQWFLEVSIVKRLKPENRLMYTEVAAYDETPMKTKTTTARPPSVKLEAIAPLLPEGQLAISGRDVSIWTPSLGVKGESTSSSTKIMQIESGVSMLVEFDGQFYSLSTTPVSGLAVVERTTARCLQAAVTRASIASSAAAASFQHSCRTTTTDKASENILCEQSIAAHMFGTAIHNHCDVHTLSRVFSQVFSACVPEDITGMIRFSLSLGVASQMNAFRRALREEIESRNIRVLAGVPTAEVRRYRELALRTFAGRGKNIIEKRMLLSLLPNGDWRSNDIEVWTGSAPANMGKAALQNMVVNGLVTALAGCMFEIYPRHRWTGADVAIDRCGLLAIVHNLGPGAYRRYLATFKPSEKGRQGEGDRQAAELMVIAGRQGRGDGGAAPDPGHIAAADGSGEAAADASNWQAFNSRSRSVAGAWWDSEPKVRLIIIRLVMEPARSLMSSYLTMAGDDWNAAQIKACLHARLAGREPHREYRVSVAASNVLEEACLARVHTLLGSDTLWATLPEAALTKSNRALAFRMLSRLACGVHELLIKPHRDMPTRLFALLLRPLPDGIVQQIKDTPPCMQDDFTKEFLEAHGGDLLADRPQAILTHLARIMKKETVDIECRHASIRRFLISKSVQTHTLKFADLGRHWVLQRWRRGKCAWPFKTPQQTAEGRHIAKGTKRRRGGGGAARAYISEQLRERGLRLQDGGVARMLNAEYRGKSAAEKRRLRLKGRIATDRWRLGACDSAFGTVHATKDRYRREHLLRLQVRHRLHGVAPETAAMVLAGEAVRQCGEGGSSAAVFRTSMRLARGHWRAHGQVRRQEEAAALDSLQQWTASEGASTVTNFIRATGGVANDTLGKFFVPEPAGNLRVLHMIPAPADALTKVASFASNAKGKSAELRAALLESWDRAHTTIVEGEAPEISAAAKTKKPSACLVAGECLCSNEGKCLAALHTAFYFRIFKNAFPQQDNERKDVAKAGFVFLQIFQSIEVVAAGGDAAVVPLHRPEQEERWVHMGLLYLSPLRATFMKMVADGGPIGRGADPVTLTATMQECTFFQLMKTLDLQKEWWVRMWILEDTEMHITAFIPGQITAVPSRHEAVCLWKPAGPGAPARMAAGGAAGDGGWSDDDEDAVPCLAAADEDEEVDDHEAEDLASLLRLLGEDEGGRAGEDDVAEAGEGEPAPAPIAPVAMDVPDDIGAAGSGALPPLPPPAAAPPPLQPPAGAPPDIGAKGQAARTKALVSIELDFGSIAFYKGGRFQATCGNPLHGKCVLTRHNTLKSHMRGRPLGFMVAWMALGHICDTKEEHWNELDNIADDMPNRIAAREVLKGHRQAQDLLDKERFPLLAGEGEEPA